jgi:hypothetical protein
MLRNKKIIVAIPHSHTWFWTQTCAASLMRNPPRAEGYDVKIILVDNSPWSPSIRGIRDTWLGSELYIIPNHKSNKFHASALDCVVENYDFDFLMALETDVLALRPTWLQWFVDQIRETDYAVGMWHHEQFVNPSCTLYRGKVLRDMLSWCWNCAPQDRLRWGPNFAYDSPLDNNLPLSENPESVLSNLKGWIGGPFAEKRGWKQGVILKEKPSGQEKGPGWYEPGQQLHHWAVDEGWTYTICPTLTTHREDRLPLQTMYGGSMHDPLRQLEAVEMFGNAETAHVWGGTRALDIIKHPVTCQFVKSNTPGWLAREARFWREVVPPEIQSKTLDMIRKYGWHTTGQGADHVSDRDREAAEFVKTCYEAGGVVW